jgi:uncharacterized protein
VTAQPYEVARVVRALVWQRTDRPGSEYFEVRATDDGWLLEGVVIVVELERPCVVRYSVVCDTSWRTRWVSVTSDLAGTFRKLELRANGEGRWWSGDKELAEIRGCIDVDLGFTPATNTLPIRRLNLTTRQSGEATAAWVTLPELQIQPFPQRYERLGERQYRYSSRGGSFTADLDVDELGLVVRYPPAWERVAVAE